MKELEISKIKIDPKLKGFMRNLTNEEFQKLSANINNSGGEMDALDVDKSYRLIDGHNRLEIAKSMGLTKVPVNVHSFKDDGEAQEFMINKQLGRRNLTPTEFTFFIGCKQEFC
jgi:ParB-like chromosome segregation protein Spo0J